MNYSPMPTHVYHADWGCAHRKRWLAKAVLLSDSLGDTIRDGFPCDDSFDAFVGLLGMLRVGCGNWLSGEPGDERTRKIEGWILAQQA